MALQYTMTDKRGYLLVKTSGHADSTEEMHQYVDALFREVRRRGYPSMLIDESKAHMRFDILNSVFKNKFPTMDFQSIQIVHIALISAPHSLELYKFFEGMMKDCVLRIKAFDDVPSGEAWLMTTTGTTLDRDRAYSYEVIDKGSYIRINLSGKINEVNDMLVLAGEMIRETSVRNTTCILVYGREVSVELDVSQAFKIAQALGDYIPLLGLRIASVPHEKQMKLDQFFETVFQNRSINYRVFESQEKAEAWLKTKKYQPHAMFPATN